MDILKMLGIFALLVVAFFLIGGLFPVAHNILTNFNATVLPTMSGLDPMVNIVLKALPLGIFVLFILVVIIMMKG